MNNSMLGKTISHYKIIEKLGEARLLESCFKNSLEDSDG